MTIATQTAADTRIFDMSPYTGAGLRFDMRIRFRGKTAEEVFAIMGDPERITDWYLLAREVVLHDPESGGQSDFDVVFTFFGRVKEEILHWDLPRRYVYRAHGKDFPIRDYVALIEVQQEETDTGVMIWQQYFDRIDGRHNRNILPVILPPINEESMRRLAPMIGGTEISVRSFFDTPGSGA